jgi:hypothetical protein
MPSLDAVRARFARNEGLPFADILTEASIRDVRNEQGVPYRDRVFSPVTTIWGFLSQVLSKDHTCRDAVSRIIAHRATNGLAVCSPNTSAYCNARSRLLTSVLSTLATRTAEELQASAGDQWKWNGRSVFIVDGSSVSMPDTPENQAVYPQPPNQKPGLGFSLARIAVLLSLPTGACHDLAIAPYQGKGTGETNLFRQMYDALKPGDVVLGDALFDDYFIACELCQRGVDIVARDKNNRVKQFKVVTTILDQSIDGKQIGDLFERRWDGEVDIRSIKSTMQMDILRCKTPDMVHKEIWTHLLAYNLLPTVMAVAANENDIEPRRLSFKGAKQALTAFAPKIEAARPEDRAPLIDAMLTTIAYHRVGDRPGRWEPRARKRRPKKATRLMQPRHIAKLPHNRSKWF